MTVIEFKEWINKLPEDVYNFPLVVRDLKDTEEPGKYAQKDDPVISALIDPNVKRLCLFNIESQSIVNKIRSEAKNNAELEKSAE